MTGWIDRKGERAREKSFGIERILFVAASRQKQIRPLGPMRKCQLISRKIIGVFSSSFATMLRSLLLLLLIIHQAHGHYDQLTLMTYNVMLLPSILVFERDQMTRADLLTRAKFLRTSDILCLQEVFQSEPSDVLLTALEETYPYSTPVLGDEEDGDEWSERWNVPTGDSPLKFVSGGVTILSKWPIVYAVEYFYNHSCSAHTFVRTGFVYSLILYGPEKLPVHVFGTHLQPNDHRGCYTYGEDRTREQQMTELNDFIRSRNISRTELVFILGDFNINRYHTQQYQAMLRILNVQSQQLHPASVPCSWDSTYNAMTNSKHDNQLLDYIFLHRDHTPADAVWLNLITDRMASKQWHLLGRNHSFYNARNIPLLELSDHYPVIGFFQDNRQSWSRRSSGVVTHVQLFTADTNLPVMLLDRELRIGRSTNESASLFILSNNGTPRRHRCLKSQQYVLLMDRYRSDFYLSNDKFLRLKYGKEHANRYLKIVALDPSSPCISNGTEVIFQSRSSTGFYYVRKQLSQLCACALDRDQAQVFRLVEVDRQNVSCSVSYESWSIVFLYCVKSPTKKPSRRIKVSRKHVRSRVERTRSSQDKAHQFSSDFLHAASRWRVS